MEELPPIVSSFDTGFPSNVIPKERSEPNSAAQLSQALRYRRMDEVRGILFSGKVESKEILRHLLGIIDKQDLEMFRTFLSSWSNMYEYPKALRIVKNLCISSHLPVFYKSVLSVSNVDKEDYLVAAEKGNRELVEVIATNLHSERKLDEKLQSKALEAATKEGNKKVLEVLLFY